MKFMTFVVLKFGSIYDLYTNMDSYFKTVL